jgi:Ca-activated chloride channel family protein
MTHLLHPWFLLLALLIPLAVWRRGRPAVLFASAEFARGLPRSWRQRAVALPRLFQIGGLVLLLFALARPVEHLPLPHATEGIDIMLCLDTSSSMTANDLDTQRSRLDVAKAAAKRFIAGRPHDRIGLVGFARYPDLRCPPTLDHAALARIVDAVGMVRSDGPEDATGIGTAVARAAQVLRASDADSKVVILLTDGDENVATEDKPEEIAPIHAAQLARDLGIRVYAVSAGLGRNASDGSWIELDTTQMRRLADDTGGKFFAARDADAVAGVYAEIDTLERIEFAEPRYEIVERFLPLLMLALALLFASRLLASTILGVQP